MAKLTKSELVETNQRLQSELEKARIALAVSSQLFSMIRQLLDRGSQAPEEKNGPARDSVSHP